MTDNRRAAPSARAAETDTVAPSAFVRRPRSADQPIDAVPASAIRVRGSRFGDFAVGEDRVLRFPLGLPGFPDAKAFVLVEHRAGSKFKWLQAIDYPDVAFLVIDPTLIVPDFPVDRVPSAMGFCELEQGEEVAVLAICSVPAEPLPATVNLLAPLGLGMRSRRGAQVNVHETGFTTDMPLVLRS